MKEHTHGRIYTQRGHTLGGTYIRRVHTHDTEGRYTLRGYRVDINTEGHTEKG